MIIDVQRALIPVLWRGEDLVARLAALTARARANGVPVIVIQQTGPTGSPPCDDRGDGAGLAAQQIIDHHNRVLSQAIHPGGRVRLIHAADQRF